MQDKFLSSVQKYDMITRGDRVLAGVSGGADSMCLLGLLLDTMDQLGITVCVAHVNHMIRGAEADRDENFVRAYCEAHNVEFHSVKINIPELAAKTGKSTELIAREERYKFFESIPHDKLATAHTRSDKAETMLMNLSRGCGLHGLTSIPAVRGKIIRPLIDFSRCETEEYCRSHKIDFVTDSTNLIADCTRNKFRLNVIPGITDAIPSFEDNAARCISSLAEDDDYFNSVTDEAYSEIFNNNDTSLSTVKLNSLHTSIKNRVIIKYLTENTCSDFEKKHVDYISVNICKPFSVTLPGGVSVCGDDCKIFILKEKAEVHQSSPLTFSKYETAEFTFNGISYFCFKIGRCEYIENKNDILIDFSVLSDNITVRSRLAGDEITLPRRKCRKSLKKYFNEIKASESERLKAAVFTDDNGIIAVAPFTEDNRCSGFKSDKLYIIRIRREENE